MLLWDSSITFPSVQIISSYVSRLFTCEILACADLCPSYGNYCDVRHKYLVSQILLVKGLYIVKSLISSFSTCIFEILIQLSSFLTELFLRQAV